MTSTQTPTLDPNETLRIISESYNQGDCLETIVRKAGTSHESLVLIHRSIGVAMSTLVREVADIEARDSYVPTGPEVGTLAVGTPFTWNGDEYIVSDRDLRGRVTADKPSRGITCYFNPTMEVQV